MVVDMCGCRRARLGIDVIEPTGLIRAIHSGGTARLSQLRHSCGGRCGMPQQRRQSRKPIYPTRRNRSCVGARPNPRTKRNPQLSLPPWNDLMCKSSEGVLLDVLDGGERWGAALYGDTSVAGVAMSSYQTYPRWRTTSSNNGENCGWRYQPDVVSRAAIAGGPLHSRHGFDRHAMAQCVDTLPDDTRNEEQVDERPKA